MLKKKSVFLVLALCAVLLLTACGQQQEIFPNQPREESASVPQAQPQAESQADAAPAQQINFDDGS